MTGQQDTCRSCGAAILWVRTQRRKAMPLDLVPSSVGNIVLVKMTDDGREVARFITPGNVDIYREDGRPTYTSHWSTCKHAARWRRDRA